MVVDKKNSSQIRLILALILVIDLGIDIALKGDLHAICGFKPVEDLT
jgi:hypothetical protein